jgi:hypothetical protein
MNIRPDPRVGEMLSKSKISRWIEMDDYCKYNHSGINPVLGFVLKDCL